MRKFYFLLLMGIVFLSSCSDVKKADKLCLEHKFDEAAALYQKAADKGDAYAMWKLGKCYADGDGVELDKKKAYEWIVKAAKAGCKEAKADVAYIYIEGLYNQPKNVKEGVKLLTKLATKTDNPYTIYRYAQMFWNGVDDEIEKDRVKADSILGSIKDKDDPYYLYLKGFVYCYGNDKTDIDENNAIECWGKAYENGYNTAKKIAELYWYGGSQIDKDIDKAVDWYKKGVEANGSGSMLELARIYLSEDTILQKYHDPKGGLQLLKKSIKHGNADACDYLGYLYSRGENVDKDDKEAFKYFKMADEYGSANGALNLGAYYLTGRGVEESTAEGMKCYERAAERGNAEAALRLGNIYNNEAFKCDEYDKAMENMNKSNEYYEKAAKLGNPQAYYIIGEHYYYAQNGYPYDYFQAFVYFKKAADAGWIDAYEYLIDMYEKGLGCDKNPSKAKEYREKLKG